MKASFRNATKLIKQFRWNSIFFKYWKKFTIVIIIPFLIINSILYIYYSKIINTEITNSSLNSFTQIKNTVKSIFDDINKYYISFLSNDSVFYFLNCPNMSDTDFSMTSNISRINDLITNIKTMSTFIDSVHIYSFASQYVLSSQSSSSINNFYNTQWYLHYLKDGKTDFIIPITLRQNNEQLISVCYALKQGDKTYGLLVINISTSNLGKIFEDSNLREHEFTLYDKGFLTIYSTNKAIVGSINKTQTEFDINKVNFTRYKNHILISSYLGNSIYFSDTIFLRKYDKSIHNIRFIFIICLLVAVFLPLFISLYISIQFYLSIEKIVINLVVPENGSHIKQEKTDELFFISRNISSIREKNFSIEKNLVEKIAELKRLQSLVLQLQFNPHFLFNTLNLISVIVMDIAKGNNLASKTISLLSDLLTISLNTKEYIVTIEEELTYAKKYLEIESIKYKNNFDIIWDVNEDLLYCKTAKFILQPILENSSAHGIRHLPKEKRGVLAISVKKMNSDIQFTITDNGVGMDAPTLKHIQQLLLNNDLPETKHIGLCNVHQRIKLIFGVQYGCLIDSNQDGTIVQITLPRMT